MVLWKVGLMLDQVRNFLRKRNIDPKYIEEIMQEIKMLLL